VAPALHPLFAAHGEPADETLAFRPRATARRIIDPTAPAPASAGLLAGGYAHGVPMHTERAERVDK
jgi:hypothetical protein